MGSRQTDTLKEIDALRARLDATLLELEKRAPEFATLGRKAIAVLSGGAGSGVALFLIKRMRARAKQHRREAAAPQVTVQVIPGSVVAGGVAIAAIWGAVKVFQSKTQADRETPAARPAIVKPLPSERRA